MTRKKGRAQDRGQGIHPIGEAKRKKNGMKSEDSLRDFMGHQWTHAHITVVQEGEIQKGAAGLFTVVLATEHNPYKEEAFPFGNPEGTEKEDSEEARHQDVF